MTKNSGSPTDRYLEKVCKRPRVRARVEAVSRDMRLSQSQVNPLLVSFYYDGRKPADYDCKTR
ncbi:MAG TPA: hypothetical protein P5116_08105 [Eubacteriales bacterium]|nr:hypothetical protein [Clostridia bacterium]HRV73821.1 hypothetical protein [Eubacteriales bacterium]